MASPFLRFAAVVILVLGNAGDLYSQVADDADRDVPRILNINSYYSGLDWTDRQTEAFSVSLHKHLPRAQIYREFLDFRRQDFSEKYLRSFNERLAEKHAGASFDLIYVTDNLALEYVQQFKDQTPVLDAPIVFSGIDDIARLDPSLLEGTTGVGEELNREKLFEIVERHHPNIQELIILSRSAEELEEHAQRFFGSRKEVKVRAFRRLYLSELETLFEEAPKDTVVLLGMLRILHADGSRVAWDEAAREASRDSDVPIYLLDDAPMWSSVVGANAGVAEDQGGIAGRIAAQLLSGASTDQVAAVHGTPQSWLFNAEGLKRFGINRSMLDADSRIVEAESLLSPLQLLLLTIGGVFLVFETALILYILSHRRRRKEAVRALQESEERLRGYLEHSPLPIAIINKDETVAYINKRHVNTFGYSLRELDDHQVWQRFFPDPAYREEVRKVWERESELARIEGRDPQPLEWKVMTRGGEVLDIQCNYTEIGNQGFAVLFDVTERNRALAALEAATRSAQAANDAKSQFLANMSHEIRTPMNGVLGMAQLLLETHPTPEQRDYISTIKDSGQLLLTVINDLLDLSKIEAGQMNLDKRSTELRPFIDSCLALVERAAREKNLRLSCRFNENVPSTIICDSNRLSQVLLNLLSNAIKFTEDGEVRVEVSAVGFHEKDVELEFRISDTGIGIAPEHLEKIFEPFNQGDPSATRRFGGTGLGLSISRRLVEMMGGQIWLKSMRGKGATFTFTITGEVIPTEPAVRLDSPNQPRMAEEYPLQILIAEDNPVNQKVARLVLRKMGYEANVAANGVETLKMLKEQSYDVILMDIQMPEMDGYTAARRIRQDLPSEQQPWIIALTAHALTEDMEKCKAAGMDDYLSKPLRTPKLVEALKAAFESREPKAKAGGGEGKGIVNLEE